MIYRIRVVSIAAVGILISSGPTFAQTADAISQKPGMTAQTTSAIPSTLSAASKERFQVSQKKWREQEGARLEPVLAYRNNSPTLRLTFARAVRADEIASNNLGILTALEFLLADDSFDRVQLTIIAYNPNRFAERTINEYVILRQTFQSVVLEVAKTQTTKDAFTRLRSDTKSLAQICAQLGLK